MSICTYCESLDVLDRDRRGVRSRCPLCKSKTLRTDSGTTYRIATDAGPLPVKGRRLPIAGVVAASVLLVAGLWVIAATRPTTSATPVETTIITPIESVAVDHASFKPGHAFTFVGLAKPTAHPPRSAGKPFATPPPPPEPKPEMLPVPARVVQADFWTKPHLPADTLLEQVARFPEVGLADGTEKFDRAFVVKNATAFMPTRAKPNSFEPLASRVRNRSDLSGLPFAFDKSRLDAKTARSLAVHSTEITRLLDGRFTVASRSLGGRTATDAVEPHRSEREKAEMFWAKYAYVEQFGNESVAFGFPALEQVLMAKSPEFRETLAEMMKYGTGPATKILVRRALFDLDPSVRRAAVEVLQARRNEGKIDEDTAKLLMEGFRYPWPPVARHAAEALVALERTDAVESLRAMRTEADPYVSKDKASTTTVREAVRVNHFKNCLLCHPPIDDEAAQGLLAGALHGNALVPVGVVPIPGEEIPKSYADEMRALVFVRADATHLRQDFSVRLDVATMAPWPTSQRFDILIRSRVLTDEEALRRPAASTLAASPNGAALAFAIEQLQKVEPTARAAR